MLSSNTALRARPRRLASYIAMSALRIRSAGARPGVLSEMPMLALTNSSWPSIVERRRRASSGCARRPWSRRRGRTTSVEQHGELVAAEPRHGVPGAQRGRDAAGERDQQVVADGVAEAVVDELEAVDVEEQDRAAGRRDRAGARCRIWLTPIHEQGRGSAGR